MSEFFDSHVSEEHRANFLRTGLPRIIRRRDRLAELDAIDIDAGRVDAELVSEIDRVNGVITDTAVGEGLGGLPQRVFEAAALYSYDTFDLGHAATLLDQVLDPDEKERTYEVLNHAALTTIGLREIFPGELRAQAASAYGESVATLIYSLNAIKREEAIDRVEATRPYPEIPLGSYTFDEALGAIDEMKRPLHDIMRLEHFVQASFMGVAVSLDFEGDNSRMYRMSHVSGPDALYMIRHTASDTFYDRVEYGRSTGAEASIGYTVDLGNPKVSIYKDEQVSPFCVRIDNEGDTLALDIGSVHDRPGTLGKQIADLLAIGSHARSQVTDLDMRLNHNPRPFAGSGLEQPERFAAIALAETEIMDCRVARTEQRTT